MVSDSGDDGAAATATSGVPYVPFTKEMVNLQFRPLLAGYFVSFGLFAITLLQFYSVIILMLKIRAKDGNKMPTMDRFFAFMVGLLLVSDIVNQIVKALWIDEVVSASLREGQAALDGLPNTRIGITVMDGLIASCAHLIYITRVIRLNQHGRDKALAWCVGLFSAALSIAQFVGAVMTRYCFWIGPSRDVSWNPSVALWLGGSSVADCVLCIAFVATLVQYRTPFEDKSNDIISRWVGFTVETNILTSLTQMTGLVLYLAARDHPFYVVISLIVPKMYIISILLLFTRIYQGRLSPPPQVVAQKETTLNAGDISAFPYMSQTGNTDIRIVQAQTHTRSQGGGGAGDGGGSLGLDHVQGRKVKEQNLETQSTDSESDRPMTSTTA